MKKILKQAIKAGAVVLSAVTAFSFAACASNESILSADMFAQELVLVQNSDEKYGFINDKGAEAVACTFDAAKLFFNGLAPVQKDGKWGYVNKKGEMQIAAKYDAAGYFYTDDCAVVGVLKGVDIKYGLIDKNGNTLVEPNFDKIEGFYDQSKVLEGEFVKKDVSVVKSGLKYGLINMSGVYVVNPDYTNIEAMEFGGYKLTRVKKGFLEGFEKNVADKSGKLISSAWYEDISETGSDDFIPVKTEGKWGAINAKGQTVVAAAYKAVDGLYNDRAVFENTDGKYGVLNEKGQIVAQPVYDSIDAFGATGFEFDATIAKKGDYFGLIDDDGKEITTFTYKGIERVGEDSFACTDVSDKVSLIDEDGKTLVESGKYEKISNSFSGDLEHFIVKNADGKYGVIDDDGKELVAPQYEKITTCSSGFFVAERGEGDNEEVAVFTSKNKEVIAFGTYDEIGNIYTDGYIVVEKDGKLGIVKKDGSALVEPKYKKITGYSVLALVWSDAGLV